jgi:hypothetical protein
MVANDVIECVQMERDEMFLGHVSKRLGVMMDIIWGIDSERLNRALPYQS